MEIKDENKMTVFLFFFLISKVISFIVSFTILPAILPTNISEIKSCTKMWS